jgi:hypothetical protein
MRCRDGGSQPHLHDQNGCRTTGCQHLDHIVHDIQQSTDPMICRDAEPLPAAERQSFVDFVARHNVLRVVERNRAARLMALSSSIGSRSSAQCMMSSRVESNFSQMAESFPACFLSWFESVHHSSRARPLGISCPEARHLLRIKVFQDTV